MPSVGTVRCEHCNCIHVLHTVVITIIIQVDGLLFFHKRTHYTFGRTPLIGWPKPYMVPEILGVSVPEAYLAGAPPVNKLTLLKSNKDLWEGDKAKRKGQTESGVEEEKMNTQSWEKTKRKQRRTNQQDKGMQMEVQGGSKDSEKIEALTADDGEKMEIPQSSKRSRNRRKKEDSSMDTSQVNDT